MSVTVHTVYLCSVTVLQCKWPRALLLLLNIYKINTKNKATFGHLLRPVAWKRNGFILEGVDKSGRKRVSK